MAARLGDIVARLGGELHGDADLLVDTGMGICPLAPEIGTPAGKPLLVVATHIHLDHVGSLHEFGHRLGPARSAPEFAGMGMRWVSQSAGPRPVRR